MYSGQFLKRLDSADGFGAQRHWRRGIGNLQLLTVHHRVFIRYWKNIYRTLMIFSSNLLLTERISMFVRWSNLTNWSLFGKIGNRILWNILSKVTCTSWAINTGFLIITLYFINLNMKNLPVGLKFIIPIIVTYFIMNYFHFTCVKWMRAMYEKAAHKRKRNINPGMRSKCNILTCVTILWQIYVATVTQVNRHRGVVTSWMLWIFWLLSFFINIIPLVWNITNQVNIRTCLYSKYTVYYLY